MTPKTHLEARMLVQLSPETVSNPMFADGVMV